MAKRVEFHGIDKLAERLHSLQGGVSDLDFAEMDSTLEELRVTQEALSLAKEEADRERARYYEIFEFAPDPYLVTTPSGRIQEANRAMAALVGMDWLIGKPLAIYVHPDDHVLFAHLLAQMRQILRGEWTLRMRLRDKSERIAHMTAGAVRGPDGEVSAIRWMIRDVTEQQRVERELRVSRRRIRSMASKLALVEEQERRRIANDIHDHISQSLAVAKLRLGMLREAVPEPQRAAVDEVRALLSQVIAQTRTLTFELSPTVLYELGLGAAIEWLLEQRSGCGIKFEFHNDAPELRLERDASVTLFQAAREVLANIIKHSQATHATFRIAKDASHVCVEAQDDGVGFEMERIRSRRPQDTGLGLVSMRERIVHLGGSVEIESAPGNGTKITLCVPPPEQENEKNHGGPMQLNVMIADDHQIVRQGLRALLEKESDLRIAAEVSNGREALAQVDSDTPIDVVIMDVAMPGLNGIEATRKLMNLRPSVKVIGLSMHNDRRFVTEMLKAGAAGFVSKESAFEELVEAIRTVTAGQTYLSPSIAGVVVDDYVRQSGHPEPTAFSSLTTREREVLQLMAEGRSTKQIAMDLSVSTKTVETHRRQIMEKLELYSVAELTKYAIREGLTTLV